MADRRGFESRTTRESENGRRFEVDAAWILGILLPLLEVARRRTNFHPMAFYVDDFIAGGFLLWAAWATQRKLPYGPSLLCAAWGIVCGGLYGSFFGQLGALTDISGVANGYVVLVKGALFVTGLVGIGQSVRHASTKL